VLRRAHELLEDIAETGLFQSIENGVFGDVKRRVQDGRGRDGIVAVEEGYVNPVIELMSETVYA
jgi:beta-lysine 5,6-aminomutase alpha subunit